MPDILSQASNQMTVFQKDEESVTEDTKRRKGAAQAIKLLEAHNEPFVTVGELAEYWLVSRKQIYKQIEAGTLPAIRLGPRLLRIRTKDALEFERNAKIGPAATEQADALSDVRRRPVQMVPGERRRNRS